VLSVHKRVVVDCCRRFDGGGETSLLFELGRLPKPGRVDIFKLLLLQTVVHDGMKSERCTLRCCDEETLEVVRLRLPSRHESAHSRKHVRIQSFERSPFTFHGRKLQSFNHIESVDVSSLHFVTV
jgi:hypothetical protein